MITVTLTDLPESSTIKIDGKEYTPPIRLKKSRRKRCITISKARYWPFVRCFKANKDITYKVKLWIKLKKPRKTIYDSPYGNP